MSADPELKPSEDSTQHFQGLTRSLCVVIVVVVVRGSWGQIEKMAKGIKEEDMVRDRVGDPGINLALSGQVQESTFYPESWES